MPTYLAIVQRDRPDMFERLHRMLVDEGDVRFLWDRRHTERRAAWDPVGQERRRGDRRQSPASTWATLGFVIVPLQEPRL
jgi:hypothetical protein